MANAFVYDQMASWVAQYSSGSLSGSPCFRASLANQAADLMPRSPDRSGRFGVHVVSDFASPWRSIEYAEDTLDPLRRTRIRRIGVPPSAVVTRQFSHGLASNKRAVSR